MIQVGIIVASWHYFANPFKLQPLNELYYATVIQEEFHESGVRVSVFDLRETRLSKTGKTLERVADFIAECDLYLFWIAKTADVLEIFMVRDQLRKAYPRSRCAAGGTHIETFPRESASQFDAVIIGPGEQTLVTLLKDLQNQTLQSEYRGSWEAVHIKDYPFPRREFLPTSAIVNTSLFEKYGGIPGTSAMFSRGCNFRCAYCVYNLPKFVQRCSETAIAEEIQYLKKAYGVSGINLRDEICLPLDQKQAFPFLEAMASLNVVWRGQTRVGTSRDILARARESGCVELALGVESASQFVLDLIRKGQTLKQVRESFSFCRELGIKTKMCLILGLPGEPPDIVRLTRELISATKPDYVNISGFCPLPGSEVFACPEKFGIRHIEHDWAKHAHLLFRFSKEEHFGLPFLYEELSSWGPNFTREQIVNNIKELQEYLRDMNMVY